MSKEQINLPTDGGTKEDQDQSSGTIKSIDRPKLPKIKGREIVGYKCECGARHGRKLLGCQDIPIFAGDEEEKLL